jgi:peptide/nickel transport system ATP-binding protein/oligopeptide transport system ATP-binding protein
MNTTDPILLHVEDLHTFFYTKSGIIKAVNGIDFLVQKGKTVGLVGESGCGKSVTALSIIRLVQSPGRVIKGRIFFENRNLLDLDEQEMRHIRGNRISMIFQEPMTSLNPVHCIGDQISEAIWLHQGLSKRKAMDLTVEMLIKVGISDPKKRIREYPHQMSGGMRQRVMIAMALSCNPKMIIADEPTTALDVTIQAQILDLMDKLRRDIGVSILLITHDLGIVAEMAHSVIVMYAGKIVEYADSLVFFDEPKHPYTLGLLGSIPKMDGPIPHDKILSAIPGVVPNLLELPEGCSFQSRCPIAFDLCKKEEPLLFEVGSNHLVRCWQFGRT